MLDQAASLSDAKENEELGLAGPSDDIGPSVNYIRRLRPGEIDPASDPRRTRNERQSKWCKASDRAVNRSMTFLGSI